MNEMAVAYTWRKKTNLSIWTNLDKACELHNFDDRMELYATLSFPYQVEHATHTSKRPKSIVSELASNRMSHTKDFDPGGLKSSQRPGSIYSV
jgi:hypothetical protein